MMKNWSPRKSAALVLVAAVLLSGVMACADKGAGPAPKSAQELPVKKSEGSGTVSESSTSESAPPQKAPARSEGSGN